MMKMVDMRYLVDGNGYSTYEADLSDSVLNKIVRGVVYKIEQ